MPKVSIKITNNDGKEHTVTVDKEPIIKLSTGETVEFIEEIGHEIEKKRKRAVYQNAVMDVNANGFIVPSKVPFCDYLEACDAILLDVIKSIKDEHGKDIAVDENWKKTLKERDYKKIKEQIDNMIIIMSNEIQAGKKNG